MKKNISLLFFLGIIFFLLLVPTTNAQDFSTLQAGQDYVPGEVIVKFKDGSDPKTIRQEVAVRDERADSLFGILQNRQEDIIDRIQGQSTPEDKLQTLQTVTNATAVRDEKLLSQQRDLYRFTSNDQNDIAAIIRQYEQSGLVEYAEPNFLYQLFAVPNDTSYSKLWGMKSIKAEGAWDSSTGAQSIKVAVVDTGVDASHPDLSTNVVETKMFGAVCEQGKDLGGHGTHVAGTIGAIGNNAAGVAGVNWALSILGYCVNGPRGQIATDSVVQAIDAAVSAGAKAVNLSLGGSEKAQSMQDSIAGAVRAGTVVIASAGNSSGATADRLYPASDPNVITVSAVGPNNELARYSSYGKSVDITAPGGNPTSGSSSCRSDGSDCILSTLPNGRYGVLAGTSMSAPHVTGLVGLMFSVNPNLTPQQVKDILQNTAQDLGPAGRDDKFGYGLINAQAALAAAGGSTGGPTPPSGGSPTQSLTQSPTGGTPPITLPPHQCQDKARNGDYDCNGTSDQADYDNWQKEYTGAGSSIVWFEFIRRQISK